MTLPFKKLAFLDLSMGSLETMTGTGNSDQESFRMDIVYGPEEMDFLGMEFEGERLLNEERQWKSEYDEFLSTQKEKDFPVIRDDVAVDLSLYKNGIIPGTKYAILDKTGTYSNAFLVRIKVGSSKRELLGNELNSEFIKDAFILPKDAEAVNELFSGCNTCEVWYSSAAPRNPEHGEPNLAQMGSYLQQIGCKHVISLL
jgi:hypothetical protein